MGMHGMPPGVRPPPYPVGSNPYAVPGGGYPGGGPPPPQLRHLLNQGPMNQKGTASMAALSHMARMGPSAAGGSYAVQKGPAMPPHHMQGMRPQPGVRQQHVSPPDVLAQFGLSCHLWFFSLAVPARHALRLLCLSLMSSLRRQFWTARELARTVLDGYIRKQLVLVVLCMY